MTYASILKVKSVNLYICAAITALSFATFFTLHTENASAFELKNSTSEATGEIKVTAGYINTYQNQVSQPLQVSNSMMLQDSVALQADQIEQSLLAQYTNDHDLIVGTYSYGSLQGLRLTKQQAEIIKNGAIPILGNRGDAPIANPEKDYVEYACGSSCSGDRAIMRCSTTPMAYDGSKTEYEVMVKGSKYGASNGGYVCVGPNSIRSQCSGIYEQNPCINGTYQLDNDWLLSIGVDTSEIRRQIEANKRAASTPPPTQLSETPAPNQPEPTQPKPQIQDN